MTAGRWRNTAAFSKFSASYKLSKGTYRVRAGFKDAAHPKTKYNSYKTIKVNERSEFEIR